MYPKVVVKKEEKYDKKRSIWGPKLNKKIKINDITYGLYQPQHTLVSNSVRVGSYDEGILQKSLPKKCTKKCNCLYCVSQPLLSKMRFWVITNYCDLGNILTFFGNHTKFSSPQEQTLYILVYFSLNWSLILKCFLYTSNLSN